MATYLMFATLGEWTEGDRLRHAKFVGLREDKNAQSVIKEHSGG
jgi:ATP-dependent DNA ligase